MKLENILGSVDEIRNHTNALTLRTAKKPFISKETQPVIYSILEKIAQKEGLTAEEYQRKMDKELI